MNNIELKKPWIYIESELEKYNLIKELKNEMNSNHVLFDKNSIPIAKREDNDDVIYKISDYYFAIVHLTWSGKQEKNGRFPYTEIFSSLKDLLDEIKI